MQMRQYNASPTAGRRVLFLLAALAASVAMSFAIAAGPVSTANAVPNQFCENYWLSPYGQPGDSCNALHSQGGWSVGEPNGGTMLYVGVWATERAGCAAVIGYYGEQYGSWKCTSPGQTNLAYVPQTGWYRGTIRNNNTQHSANFSGFGCCWQ